MATRSLDRIAQELVDLRRQIFALSSQPQLAHSSLEGGYLLFNENDGTPGVVVGEQFDGSNTASSVTGPPPPTPTTPAVEAHLNSAKVTWDGLFVDGIVPMDFSRVEIHAVDAPTDAADTAETLVGTYETPRGGDTMVPLSGPKYIRFVTRSLPGNRSAAGEASALVDPVTSADITAEVEGIANDAHDIAVAAQGVADSAHDDAVAAQAAADAAAAAAGTASSDAATAIGNAAAAAAAASAAQGDADAAQSDADALEARFPIANIDLADGAVTTAKIGAGEVHGTNIADGSITTPKLVAGVITANELAAGAVTANKLQVVIGGGNLVPDSGFESSVTNPYGWAVNTGTGVKTTAQHYMGTQSYLFTPGSENYAYFFGPSIDLVAGRVYTASIYVRSTTSQSLALRDYGDSGTTGPTVAAVANTWTRLKVTFTAGTNIYLSVRDPARARQIDPIYVDGFQVEEGDVATAYAPKTDEILPGTIATAMLQAGSVTANEVAAGAITTTKLYAQAVTAAKIAVGTITGDRIAAGTITAGKLVVTNMSNLIDAGGFEGDVSSWSPSAGVVPGATIASPPVGGTKGLTITGSGVYQAAYFQPYSGRGISVVPGETYLFTCSIRRTSGTASGTAGMDCIFKKDNGSPTYVPVATVDPSTLTTGVWTTLSAIITVPAGLNEMTPEIIATITSGSVVDFDNVVVRKATDATLIVDGSVIAAKIAAGAITTDKLNVIMGGGNMLSNSGFANSAAWPAGFGFANRTAETTTTYYAGKALRLTNTGNSTFGLGAWLVNGGTVGDGATDTFRPGQKYVCSVWAYVPTASTNIAGIKVQVDNAASASIPVVTTKGSWVRVSSTFTAGAAASGPINIIVVTQGALTSGQTDYYILGAMQLETGDVPTAYAPKTDEILPGTINTAMLQAGSIDATVLSARTITTDKMAIGSFDNLLADPTFTVASTLGKNWQTQTWASIVAAASRSGGPVLRITNTAAQNFVYNLPLDAVSVDSTISSTAQDNLVQDPNNEVTPTTWSGLGSGWTQVTTTGFSPGDAVGKVLRYTANNVYSQIGEPMFPVSPNQTFELSYYMRRQGTTPATGNVAPLIFFYDSSGTYINTGGSPDQSAVTMPTSWTQVTATITAPSNAAFATLSPRATAGVNTGTFEFDQMSLIPTDAVTSPTPTKAGDSFLLTAWVKSSAPQTGNILLAARFKLKDGTYSTFTVGESATCAANTWTNINGQVTAPANAVSVSFLIETLAGLSTGTVDFDYVSATRASTGLLIVDGEIRGQHISAKSITTSHLVADFFEAGFVYTGNLQVGQITLDDTQGLQIPGPDGVTVFPVDGTRAQLVGGITTDSISIKNDLTISGLGQIQGEVDLSNGVSSPTNKPVVSQYWPNYIATILGDGTNDSSNFYAGLDTYHGNTTNFVTASILFGTKIRVVGKAAGGWGGDIGGGWSSQFYGWGGVAYDGTYYYILGSDNDRNTDIYIYQITTAGVKNAEIRLGNQDTFHGEFPRLVGNAASGRVGMVWIPNSGDLTLRWYNSSLTQVGSDITLKNNVGQQDIGGAIFGDNGSGAGASTLWVSMAKGSALPNVMCWTSVSTTAATRSSSYDFPRANGNQLRGMAYDSTAGRMMSVDSTGKMWTYSKIGANNTAPSIQAAYTFWDGDTTGSTHETLPSPTQTFAMSKRAWPVVTCSPAPDEKVTDVTKTDKADRIGLYISNGGTLRKYADAGTTDGYLAKGVRTVTADQTNNLDTLPTTGTVPISNGFASAATAPGSIQSVALRADNTPKTILDGSGAARLDGLVPPGAVIMWGAPSAIPTGWLDCDGSSKSTATYPDLFAAIGYTYGGSGSSFNLPDMRHRYPAGASGTLAVGQNDGITSESTRTTSHKHDVANTGASTTTATGGTNRVVTVGGAGINSTGQTGATMGNTGGVAGDAFPHLTLRFLIRT